MTGCNYCPVAVTPHTNENVTVLMEGRTGILMPAPCSDAIETAGQTAPPEDAQLTCVQFKPVTTGSFNTVPSPSDGPPLVTVSAYIVVLPATNELTPLLFDMARLADRVLVKVQLESALAGGVNTAVRVLPVKTAVGVGDTAVPNASSLTHDTEVMYLVMLVLDPEVSVTVTEPDRLC